MQSCCILRHLINIILARCKYKASTYTSTSTLWLTQFELNLNKNTTVEEN